MAYSERVLELNERPLNAGSLDKNDPNVGTGLVGAPACLSGSTLVPLADGRGSRSLKELAEAREEKVAVYTRVEESFRPTWGYLPRKTKENVRTLKIEFDDDTFLVCTPDHELFGFHPNGVGGTFRVKADSLKPGNSIRPFNRRNDNGHYRIFNGQKSKWEHRLMIEYLYNKDIKGMEVHHINENGLDNTPSNLVVLTKAEHSRIHRTGDKNPMRRYPEKNHFRKGFKGSTNGRWIQVDSDQIVAEAREDLGLEFTTQDYQRWAKKKGYPQRVTRFGNIAELRNRVALVNHRVRSVTEGPTEDVYCLTVPETGSFVVATKQDGHSGVLVSNCGDVMKLQLRINPETGIVEDSKFLTFGCGSAIASSSLVTEWVKGKTIEEAGKITNMSIAKELSLPPVKIHCSLLAEDAIKAAIADFRAKQAAKASEPSKDLGSA